MDGLRSYNVYLKGDGIIMESESGKQGWDESSSWVAYLKKLGVEKQIRILSAAIWSRLVGMPRFLSSPENCDLHQDV